MCGVPTEMSAVARARWLAEISEALNKARDALIGLDIRRELREEAAELFLRIEAARFEANLLRSSRALNERDDKSPKWIKMSAWTDQV